MDVLDGYVANYYGEVAMDNIRVFRLSALGEPERPRNIRIVCPTLVPNCKRSLFTNIVYSVNIGPPRIITYTSSWRAI